MEGKKLSEDEEDEDEQFLVEEAAPPAPDMPEMDMEQVSGQILPLTASCSYIMDKHEPGIVISRFFFLLQESTQELDGEEKHGTQSYFSVPPIFVSLLLSFGKGILYPLLAVRAASGMKNLISHCSSLCRRACEKDP